ncbi:MAG: hypothetical protein LBU97_01415, partial [Alistipes sp.]|nr:hypothetical protein [Alistipes sp.]
MAISLHNVEVHTSCYCYDKEASIVAQKQFKQSDSGSFDLYSQEILFVTRGMVTISLDWHERTLNRGEFVYLPVGATVNYKALSDCDTLSVRIPEEVPECNVFQVSKIAERIDDKYEGIYALRV